MIPATKVAQYILSQTDYDTENLISNLKLQKLLYYLQGFTLVLLGEPLFPEPIEAWDHGPVVVEVYHKYKNYGGRHIPPEEYPQGMLDEKVRDVVDEVYSEYGQYSAWKLRQMTHSEAPWKDAYQKEGQGAVITHQSLIDYFSHFVE